MGRAILAVILGVLAGGTINTTLVFLGSLVVAPPTGVDPSDLASVAANIDRYEVQHFIPPLLAHALGTLVGCLTAVKLTRSHELPVALVVALLNLAGGIFAAVSIPAPQWFLALDLVCAYLPMGWLGYRLGIRR